MKKLIIIPAYNEALNIASLLTELKNSYTNYDLLVINDGSVDETSSICRRAGVEVLDLPINLGIGGAMQTGYRYGCLHQYDVVIQMDGDGQHDPSDLETLVEPILQGNADLVIGSRYIRKEGFQSSFWRRIGIRFYSYLIKQITGQKFSDPTSGYRAASKEAVAYFAESYPVDYPEPESIVALLRLQYRLMEIPVRMRKRMDGVSSINGVKSLYYMTKVTMAILIDQLKKERRRPVNR